ncbi:MAG TPA: hypothetical protein VKE94_18845, partial [Gemmataceae bacterium]|nr:hypothetical protein [Gemmataceae bacterium]
NKAEVFREHEQLQIIEQRLFEKNEPRLANIVRQLMAALEFEMWLRDKSPSERLYFGGSLRVADLLDFVTWRKIADKLGITLTQADIRADINAEAFNHFPLEEDGSATLARIARMVRNPRPDLTIDEVYTALGDELRVYLAQSAVLGYPPGVRYYRYVGVDFNHVPSIATPDEFWKFYQDNRTVMRVEMLPIKVSDFLDKVGTPPNDEATEQALEEMFENFKENDPNPLRDEPAFHEPRRVSIEWVAARPDSPHARQQAERFVLGILSGSPGNPFPALSLMANVVETYDRAKTYKYAMPGLLEGSFDLSYLRDPSKPADVAAMLGQTLGCLTTGADPFAIPAAYVAGVTARSRQAVAPELGREIQRRAGVDAALVAAGQNPWAAAMLLDAAANVRQSLPLEVVAKEIYEEIRGDFASRFAREDLTKVKTELEKFKGRPEEARRKEANEYLAKAVKDYGLTHGKTEAPNDIWNLAGDKGLKPLRDVFGGGRQRKLAEDHEFASQFFDSAGPYLPKQLAESYLYWKTEDKKAYKPTFQEARPKVIEAWRFKKARELARQAAERILQDVAKLKSPGDGYRLLRDESAKHPAWGETFALSNVAKLVYEPTRPGAPTYVPYLSSASRPEESQIMARSDFVDQLMRGLKARGDVTVVWNQPETAYYVALAMDVSRPDENSFYRDYSHLRAPGDNLWQIMEAERRRKFYQATMEQMRTEAGAPKGKWDVPDDVRKRIEGRESGGEES